MDKSVLPFDLILPALCRKVATLARGWGRFPCECAERNSRARSPRLRLREKAVVDERDRPPPPATQRRLTQGCAPCAESRPTTGLARIRYSLRGSSRWAPGGPTNSISFAPPR